MLQRERPARAEDRPKGSRSEVTAYKRAGMASTAVGFIVFFSIIAGSYYLPGYLGGPNPAASETQQETRQSPRDGPLIDRSV
jgi:hypothetical protein